MENLNASSPHFSVRPNPSTGNVEVYAFGTPAGQVFPLELLTISGTPAGKFSWNGKSVQLDLSQFPKGVYILKMQTKEGTEVKKLILQ
jgi:hypothetical protein